MALLNAGYYKTHPEKFSEFLQLQLAKSSDFEVSRSAANTLLIDNEGFLKSTLNHWVELGDRFDFDEMLAEAREAFWKAIKQYDLKFDVSIRGYARYHLMEVRKQNFKNMQWVEFKPEHEERTCTINLSRLDNLNLSSILYEAMDNCLTPIEKEVVELFYLSGIKQRKIAILRDCSEARVSQIVKTSLPKLRTYLNARGIEPSLFQEN
jgi:RNA polymerase sigma factor (sigma-70 family)